jgi:hypothetical protein
MLVAFLGINLSNSSIHCGRKYEVDNLLPIQFVVESSLQLVLLLASYSIVRYNATFLPNNIGKSNPLPPHRIIRLPWRNILYINYKIASLLMLVLIIIYTPTTSSRQYYITIGMLYSWLLFFTIYIRLYCKKLFLLHGVSHLWNYSTPTVLHV